MSLLAGFTRLGSVGAVSFALLFGARKKPATGRSPRGRTGERISDIGREIFVSRFPIHKTRVGVRERRRDQELKRAGPR